MVLAEEGSAPPANPTNSTKRRTRRKKLKLAVQATNTFFTQYFSSIGNSSHSIVDNNPNIHKNSILEQDLLKLPVQVTHAGNQPQISNTESSNMSSKETLSQSRDEVKAAREAKKLAKQKAKNKDNAANTKIVDPDPEKDPQLQRLKTVTDETTKKLKPPLKCVDEVDRAYIRRDTVKIEAHKGKDQIFVEEADKKSIKQHKLEELGHAKSNLDVAQKNKPKNIPVTAKSGKNESKSDVAKKTSDVKANPDMTVKDVVETLKDIKKVAQDVQNLTAKVSAISFEAKEPEAGKSKAELKAERRAKQEAQRAAKQAAVEQKSGQVKDKAVPVVEIQIAKAKVVVKEKSPKPKPDKLKVKSGGAGRVNWFQHLHTEPDRDALNKIPINSNLHPAIIKLGVRLATRVVSGSNARCVALLDALKKMVRDYTLPAKTEFSRGLESHLAASLEFLWSMRRPSASQTNAVKYFRHHLTQLPNNVDEFDAKKKLQEEIDKYIEDQIDKAGEAISEAVRHKISNGDNILTYGCSSLIERILREAWEAKVEFRTIIVGNRVHNGAREMLRRLTVAGLHCTYADITAVSYVMKSINKVILGASSLLVNGSVLGSVGTAQVALAAKECNVPVLVACETHKFSENVQTDAFVYNELGNPDELINQCDPCSPLKDWRTNPNLTLLNVTYDVTPPALVTAVVTEKAILPCTSAPVVLRTKLSEYGM